MTIATTLKEGLVVGRCSIPGNPWEGHTLAETVEQVSILAEHKPVTAIVDKGYQGVLVEGVQILRSGQRRGVTRTMKAMIKRRSAIKPTIGHMKSDGRLARNPLKGALGDALHAVMCGDVRGRPQHPPAAQEAAAFFALCWGSICRRRLMRYAGRNGLNAWRSLEY